VSIDSGQVGGPSAGLAFTLGLIDKLSAGELTGGRTVAATGTIDVDGFVGDVGGVPQKTAAVIASGASVFLVPANEFDEATARAGTRLEVVKVDTLKDALSALGRLGGDVAALGAASTGTPG
jgi:PDZ domain-containing protein